MRNVTTSCALAVPMAGRRLPRGMTIAVGERQRAANLRKVTHGVAVLSGRQLSVVCLGIGQLQGSRPRRPAQRP